MERQTGGHVAQMHRKQRRRQVAAEPCPQTHPGTGRTPDVGLDRGIEQRPEKAQALDVIHVQVGQQDVDPAQRARERGAEPAHARPGIEDQHGAVMALDGNTRGVAAIAGGPGPRRGNRSPRSPKG